MEQIKISRKRLVNNGDFTEFEIGYVRKELPDENEKWKRDQFQCLPKIAELAKAGCILLFKGSEVQIESMHRRKLMAPGKVFESVHIQHADSAIERSFFEPNSFSEYIRAGRLVSFCKSLLSASPEWVEEKLNNGNNYPANTLSSLRNLARFKELCEGLAEKQYPDAFHLWTAEVNKGDFFLTADKKFLNAMCKSKKIKLPCMPVSPEGLLERFDFKPDTDFEFKNDDFVPFLGPPKKIKDVLETKRELSFLTLLKRLF